MMSGRVAAEAACFAERNLQDRAMNNQNRKPRAIAVARTREADTARLWQVALVSLGACSALAMIAAAALLG